MELPPSLDLSVVIPVLDRLTADVLGPMMPEGKSELPLEHFPVAALITAIEDGEAATGSLAENADRSRRLANEYLVVYVFLGAVVEFQTTLGGFREIAYKENFEPDQLAELRSMARQLVNGPEQHADFLQEFMLYLIVTWIEVTMAISQQAFESQGIDARLISWDDFRTSSHREVCDSVRRSLGRKVKADKLTSAQYPLYSWAVCLLKSPSCKGEVENPGAVFRVSTVTKKKRKSQ